jgi:hypothetical protein
VRHENVSVATGFSAQHSAAVRWSIHLASAVVLVVLWTAKPRRLQATVPVGLVLIMINALATSSVASCIRGWFKASGVGCWEH